MQAGVSTCLLNAFQAFSALSVLDVYYTVELKKNLRRAILRLET